MSNLNIVKPYYKYKQEAYNNLNKLGKSLLREFGFYKQYPEYSEDDLIIYHDPSILGYLYTFEGIKVLF